MGSKTADYDLLGYKRLMGIITGIYDYYLHL